MIALLAPGQGAQTPGMLEPWLELDGVEEQLARWSELTGLDLVRLGTSADEEEVKDTAVTQPLIVALSLIGAQQVFRAHKLPEGTPVAGHSVGELTAAAIAGVLSYDDAVRLAAVRGREMGAACALEPTGMSAVMGPDRDVILRHLELLGLDAANYNGAGQIVAAGHRSALQQLTEEPPEGTRVRPLAVAGAFHTRFMQPARDDLRKFPETIQPSEPRQPLLSNADGSVVAEPPDILNRLIDQVTKPVRWDSCMATLAELGVRSVIELPPAGALVGMMRREIKGTTTVAYKKPADLAKVSELLAEESA